MPDLLSQNVYKWTVDIPSVSLSEREGESVIVKVSEKGKKIEGLFVCVREKERD